MAEKAPGLPLMPDLKPLTEKLTGLLMDAFTAGADYGMALQQHILNQPGDQPAPGINEVFLSMIEKTEEEPG
jgi:hypothetical protein